jgi:hypothetical protein
VPVRGEPARIAAFLVEACTDEGLARLDFERILPARGSECEHRDTSRSCTFRFETPWSPPVPLIETLAGRYPHLSFELAYAEPMMEFAGAIGWEQGRQMCSLEYRSGYDTAPAASSLHFCALQAQKGLGFRLHWPNWGEEVTEQAESAPDVGLSVDEMPR